MKIITFFTIHQAPHNTFIFKVLEKDYSIKVFFSREKLTNYDWEKSDFFYKKNIGNNFFKQLKSCVSSDLVIVSGWQNIKHIFLIIIMFIFNRKFAIYMDLGVKSLKKYKIIKKSILRNSPVVLITGIYGEIFMKKYLRKESVFNFPYGVKSFNLKTVEMINMKRSERLIKGDKMRVFISNRFIERKGYNIIRSLLLYLKKEGFSNNFQFIIAGNGDLFEYEKTLIHEIDNKVIFLGWIDYEMYRENMLNCDIFLHCSEYEPYGIPPIDAFLCNKTIILTKNIYSKYDILNFGGKVFEFDYKKPYELHLIMKKIIIDSSILYKNKQTINTGDFLFSKIHLDAICGILS